MLRIKSGFSGERSLVLPKMVTDMMAADAIVSVLYVTDIGYYPKAENHYRERREPIDQYVFIYCIDGRGSYEVGGNSYEVVGIANMEAYAKRKDEEERIDKIKRINRLIDKKLDELLYLVNLVSDISGNKKSEKEK